MNENILLAYFAANALEKESEDRKLVEDLQTFLTKENNDVT
jgi:hypothetical protein